ncbi:hypothetical protein [Thermovibrio sp.]
MSRILSLGLVALSLALSSCATLINQTKKESVKNLHCAVVPFKNYSETPLAGKRVSAILYGVLKSKGYKVELSDGKNLQEYNCLIGGFVNEWRYKVGIDGEPAVSITYFVEDLRTGKKIDSGTLSATEWGNKSLGLLTQELFDKAF